MSIEETFPEMKVVYQERFKTLTIDHATTEDLQDYSFPENIDSLCINGDYLDHLVVPQGVSTVTLGPLGLRSLVLPDGVEFLYCSYNNLRELEIPESILMADLGNNPLYKLRFRGEPTNLVRLELRNTNLKSLYAKINPECLIDVHGTSLMLSGHMSKEVREVVYMNMYNGEGYTMHDWRRN